MQPQTYDFPPLTRGDTEVLGFILSNQDTLTQLRALADLNGATVTWSLKTPGGLNIEKTTAADGGLTLDVAAATVTWSVTPADWANMTGNSYTYKVRVTLPGGAVQTYLKGTIMVED